MQEANLQLATARATNQPLVPLVHKPSNFDGSDENPEESRNQAHNMAAQFNSTMTN